MAGTCLVCCHAILAVVEEGMSVHIENSTILEQTSHLHKPMKCKFVLTASQFRPPTLLLAALLAVL
jgi:hypothetical protein